MNIGLKLTAALCFSLFSFLGISQNCTFTLSANFEGPTCPGSSEGWIDLEIDNIDPGYTIQWQSFSGSLTDEFSEDQFDLIAGNYLVIVTDTSGCEEYLQVILPDGVDATPPQIFCPSSMSIDLGPGECAEVVEFSVTAYDNCVPDLQAYQTDSTGFVSGDAFPIGSTTLTFETVDGLFTATCSFLILVKEFDPPGTPSISCTGPLNVALDEDCSALIDANTLLNGNLHGCYDDYDVVFLNASGLTITPDEFHLYIGKTVYGRVYDPDSDTYCFSTINLKDQLKPVINCVDTIEVSCGATLADVSPDVLGFPEINDNCSATTFTYFDQLNDLTCTNQYAAWIKRTWNAEDASGNDAVPCLQYIFFKRKNLSEVTFPKSLTDNPSDLPSLDCDNPDISPANTGVPTVNGFPIYPVGSGYCEFQASYSDNYVASCGAGYNILRNWTVFDPCKNETKTHLQLIRIKDKQPPGITCLPNYTVSTNTGDCKAAMFVPIPFVDDDCSDYTVQILHSSGALTGNLLINLAVGQHTVTYRATDECGNESQCTMLVQVHDGYPPTAICDPSKAVSLTSTGQTSLIGTVFNNGSYDDCGGNLQFAIRRISDPCSISGTDWANNVKFCCEDVGTSVPVQVRVTDFSGNSSTCNSQVLISDFLPPNIICPSSLTINCDTDFSDLSIFGKIALTFSQQSIIVVNGAAIGTDGLATDNCSVSVEELSPDIDIDDCNTGTINRYFKVTDEAGQSATCAQTISVVNNDPFYINPNNPFDPLDDVEFPPNITISDCAGNVGPLIAGQPIILGNGCGQVSTSYTDQLFSQNGSSYTLKRKWTVIDFCQFGGGQGVWYYTQQITVVDSDVVPPHITGFFEVKKYCVDENDCGGGEVSFILQATDDCTPASQLVWEYKLDIDNDGDIDINGNANAIFGTLPMGIHKTTWKVTDMAGNFSTGIQFLIVEDCTPPVPICHDTLYVTLNSSGELTMPAEYLQANYSEDNCTAYPDLRFEVNNFDPNYQLDYPPADANTEMVFGCPVNTYHLQLWVGDDSDNWSNCQFHVDVSDFFMQCDDVVQPPISIDGNILTEDGSPVGQVAVQVNSNSPAPTDNSGYYAFYGLPAGGDFTINPRKNTAPLNGVTTYDMVLIRRHILAIDPLDSPYKIIAADINRSNSVTTFDLVALQKLILHIDVDFENNESWRFVDAAFIFPNDKNPFETPFPEIRSYNNLFDSKKVDFIGIKVGDVNGSANPLGIDESLIDYY